MIAHEVGHHVQNLLGISDKVQAAQRAAPSAQANALSVRLELQADCFAGVWANNADRPRNILEQGDVEEALERRRRHRRRPPADAGARARGARELHPRLLRAARALVPARLRVRRSPPQCDTFAAKQL